MTTLFSAAHLLLCAQTAEKKTAMPFDQKMMKMIPVPGKTELGEFRKLFQPGIRFSNYSVESSLIYNHSLVTNDLFSTTDLLQSSIRNVFNIEVNGIPLMAEYVRRESVPSFIDYGNDQKNWYNISFDVESYRAKWQKLAAKLGPGALSKYGSQAKALKQVFTDKLIASYKEKAGTMMHKLFDSISGNINPLDLEGRSPQEISSMIFGQNLDVLLEDAKRQAENIRNAEMIPAQKDSAMALLDEKIAILETKHEYVKKLHKLLEASKAAGINDMIRDLDGKAVEEYNRLLNDPAELARKMAAKYNLGGVEKIISLLSGFKAGGQSLPFATNLNMPFLSKGISFELNLGDKFLGFSTGNIMPSGNFLQLTPSGMPGIDSSASFDKPYYWFLNYRKGLITETHHGIRLTSISNMGSGANQLQPASLKKKNILLIDLYSREHLFGNNWLNAEISKSITSGTAEYITSGNGSSRASVKNEIFTLDNISLKLKTEGSFEKAGITHQAYFNKLIGAYYNSMDSYLSGNGYEAGFSVRMKQRGKKISAYLKGNTRNFITPGGTDSKWNSTDLRASISYKMKKGQHIQLSSMIHDGYKRYFNAPVPLVIRQQNKGLTADVSLVNKRIFGLYNTSFISAGYQKDIFPLTGVPGKESLVSNSLNLLWNQAFLYGDHLLQANLVYTKVSQDMDAFLYNTRLDVDAGGTFRISKNISAGLSVVYGYFKGAYSNIGIKPGFSGLLFKKLQLDINADVRKNIRLINPLFSQFINLDCAVKYTLK